MEKKLNSVLLDEYLQSLDDLKAVETDPFFYTKLKGRMLQQEKPSIFFFKPAWVVVTLSFFLVINTWMILQKKNSRLETTESKSSIQVFAETYNLNSDSNY